MEAETPTIIVPYCGPGELTGCRDVFVTLRPETNGVLVESTLLKVIQRSQEYRRCIEMVYLANIPGEFILKMGILERRYHYKLPFARTGKRFFTEAMKLAFSRHFEISFEEAEILGSFAALERMGLTEEELFDLRVLGDQVIEMNEQSIKRIGDIFVVNYDIPAILHKNNASTDIAVMVFRSVLGNDDFHQMIDEMAEALRGVGILRQGESPGHAFHHSGGPFEQLLDARSYLYDERAKAVSLENMQFYLFLRRKGLSCDIIQSILDNPIMEFKTRSGETVEDCIFAYTEDDSYEEAFRKYDSATGQVVI